jgi:hypothetical protein
MVHGGAVAMRLVPADHPPDFGDGTRLGPADGLPDFGSGPRLIPADGTPDFGDGPKLVPVDGTPVFAEPTKSADTGTALSHSQLPAGSGGPTLGGQAAGSPSQFSKAALAKIEAEPWAFGPGLVERGPVDVRKHHLPRVEGKGLARTVMGDESNTARMIENIIPSAANLVGDTASMAYDGTEQLLALFTQLMPDRMGGDWARRKLFEPGKGMGWASRDIINNPGRAAADLGKAGQSLKHYYWDEGVKPLLEGRLGESAIEDPVGFWFDIGGAVAGGAAGLAKAGSRAAKRWPRLVPTKSNLQQTYGRLSEAIGSSNYDIIQRNKTEQALAAGRLATETAGYTLKPWVQVMLESIPYMGTNEFGVSRALMMGDKLKNAVNSIPKVGEALAKRLGLSRGQLEELSRIAEAIPAKPQDRYGYLRLGILESGKDGEKYWKHGLDPETLRETIAGLPPDAQRLLLAYIEPKNGWDGPPWLAEKGLADANHGETALKRLAELSGTDERTIAFNRSMHGRNFVSAIAGQDPAKRRLAEVARIYLDTEAKGKHGDWNIVDPNAGAGWGRVPAGKVQDAAQLQGQEPGPGAANSRLSPRRSPVPEGEHWLNVPGRSSREKPGTITRERAHEELVEAGVLEPRQHLEGYVTHMGVSPKAAEAARLKKTAPELELSPITPGMARERLEGLSAAPPLDEAITAYRTAAEEAKLQRAMLRELGPRLLTRVEPEERFIGGQWQMAPGRVRPENMVRTVSEWDPWAKKEVTRQEPLTLVEVGAEEATAMGMEPGRYMIPEPFAERFNVLMGRAVSGKLDTPIEGFKQFVRDLFRYWKANVLVAPGTVATNLIGGGTQYMGKVLEDLGRGDLRKVGRDLAAPIRALSPKAVKALPPEVLGTNIATQFNDSTAIFFKAVQDRLKAGEQVSLPKRALGRLDQALGLGLNLALKPFGMVDNYWKRAIYLSELETWARREARQMVKAGKAPAGRVGELAEELATGAFRERPGLHKEIMQGPVDIFAYDYDNIPIGLQKFRESTLGAATVPFPVYPYKYGRMLGRQLSAFNPYSELPLRERIARGGSLIGSVAGGEYLRRKLVGGESQVEADLDRFREEYPDTETQVAYPYLGGREYVGSSTGPDGKPKEHWLRTAKYGYLNLPKAFKSYEDFLSFADEFKTTGPAVAIGANLLGMVPRQFGPRDLPGQIGELVSGLIPAHRVVEFVAKVNDDFKRRLPRGFWEEILVKFPGGREFIHQPMDKWNRKLAQDDRLEEWLKFLSGVNLKTVDVAAAKEAMSEAVARASDRGMDDDTRLTIYTRWSGLEPEKIEPYLKKIKQAEGNAMLAYRKVEHNVFYQALIRGLEAMDPVGAAEITDLKRRAGREVVTHGFKGAGLRNQADVRQALRIVAGLDWIREHLNKEGGK